MTLRAHALVMVGTLAMALYILRLVRLRQLRSKYALLWLVIGLAMVPLAFSPGLLDAISDVAGVYYAPATFLALAAAFLFVVVIHYSWELSRLEARMRTLAEEVALLRLELRSLPDTEDDGVDAIDIGPAPVNSSVDPAAGDRG